MKLYVPTRPQRLAFDWGQDGRCDPDCGHGLGTSKAAKLRGSGGGGHAGSRCAGLGGGAASPMRTALPARFRVLSLKTRKIVKLNTEPAWLGRFWPQFARVSGIGVPRITRNDFSRAPWAGGLARLAARPAAAAGGCPPGESFDWASPWRFQQGACVGLLSLKSRNHDLASPTH